MLTAVTTTERPTARLPPIATIGAVGTARLLEALDYLRVLYRPQVRGSRRARSDKTDDDDDLQRLQSDASGRAYAIRWLTALIVRLDARREESPPQLDCALAIDDALQQAASLLAICAGVAAAGKVQRRFTFHAPPNLAGAGKPQTQVSVLLTDIPLDNRNYASVGAQTWGGACVLAEMVVEHPDWFGLPRLVACSSDHDLGDAPLPSSPFLSPARQRPLRILELGSGTGLVGLAVAKLLQAFFPKSSHSNLGSTSDPTIVLTDFYPAVLDNLQSNIDANFPSVLLDTNTVHVYSHILDWSSFPTMSTGQIPSVLSAPFDLVFGADIVYEAQHATWIRDCLASLLRRPYPRSYPDGSVDEDPAFHLVIPLRPTHSFESSTVEAVFGPSPTGPGEDEPQQALTILSKESIVCKAYGDEWNRADDDVEYVYYRIGWSQCSGA